MILYGGSKLHPVSATPTEFASQIGQFPPYDRAKVPSTAKTRNQIFHPPVSATPTHMLRICVNPRHALSAGVQTMRARICSAFSCDMFARVV